MKALLVFPSVHDCMEAEAVLGERGVKAEMIPTPRAISSDCGMCVELDAHQLEKALDALRKKSIPQAVFEVRERRYLRLE